MKKEKNKLLRFAMLCMVLVLSASETWGSDITMYVNSNPTGIGKVYAKPSDASDTEWEENSATVNVEPESSVSLPFDVMYDDVQPNYFFVGWSEDEAASSASSIASTDPVATFIISEDATVFANFSRVKVQSSNSNYGYAKVNKFLLADEEEATLNATTNEGCKFNGWLRNDATEPSSTNATYSFTVSDATAGSYTASFSVKTYPGLEVNSTGGRFVFYSDEACSEELSDKPNPGATIYMKAIPDLGYTVGGIDLTAAIGSDNITVTPMESNPSLFKMLLPNDDYDKVTITATFQQTQTMTVSYVDETYTTKSVEAIVLDATMTNLTPGYYVVPAGGLTFTQPISCTQESEAPLVIIIPDGATLTIGTAGAPITGSIALNAPKCKLGLYGQANATGKIVVNAAADAGAISSCKYVAIAHLDVTCSDAISVLGNGTGCTISGHQTNGNTVAVKTSGSYGLNIARSLTINNCDLDVEAGLTGITVWGTGTGLFITGKADGSNTVKVVAGNDTEFIHYGISSDSPLIIKNCSVDVSVAADYSTVGISANNITIEGIAAGTNTLTVRDCMTGLDSRGNAVTLSNLDVDIISNSTGISAGGSGKLTITGRTTGTPNQINVTSTNSYGINFSGGPAEISNCDIVVNSQGNGFNGSGSPLTITGRTTGTPNKIIVTTTSGNGFSLGSVTTTISDCDIEVNSGACGFTGGGGDLIITGRATADTPNHIYVTSGSPGIDCSGKSNTTISNCDIVVNSANHGFNGGGGYLNIISRTMGTPNKISVTSSGDYGYGFSLGGCTTTISNCDVEVNSKSNCFNLGGSSLTITGRTTGTPNKIDVTSTDGNGIGGGGASVTFSSCNVEMNSKGYGINASGSYVKFDKVNATITSGETAIYSTTQTMITDSKLTATCTGTYDGEESSKANYCGLFFSNSLTIDGSQVTVAAPYGYKGIYSTSTVNLSWKHDDDFIYADSYGGNQYAKITAVKTFVDDADDNKMYYGNISVTRDDNKFIISTPIDGVKLVPWIGMVTVGPGEFVTLYTSQYNLIADDKDALLLTISSVRGTTAIATEIPIANAGMPFLIYNKSDVTKDFILYQTDDSEYQAVYPGFKGTDQDKSFSTADMAATNHYVLDENAFVWVKSAGTIAAHRCWIEMAKNGNAASRLSIEFADATGVSEVSEVSEVNEGDVYDLNGRKMIHGTSQNGTSNSTLRKGVYIQNGKKVVK